MLHVRRGAERAEEIRELGLCLWVRPSPELEAARKRTWATGEAGAESHVFGVWAGPASAEEVDAAVVFLIAAVEIEEVVA